MGGRIMSNTVEASIYEILNIEKLNKETNETEVVNIKGKTVSFKYYEGYCLLILEH